MKTLSFLFLYLAGFAGLALLQLGFAAIFAFGCVVAMLPLALEPAHSTALRVAMPGG